MLTLIPAFGSSPEIPGAYHRPAVYIIKNCGGHVFRENTHLVFRCMGCLKALDDKESVNCELERFCPSAHLDYVAEGFPTRER